MSNVVNNLEDITKIDAIEVVAGAAAPQATTYSKTESDIAVAGSVSKDNTDQTKIGSLTIGESISVTAWSYVTTVITLTVASHNSKVGDTIYVSGLTSDTTIVPNGTYTVTSVTATTVVYDSAVTQDAATLGVSSALVKYGELKSLVGLDTDLVRGLPADFTSSKAVNGYQKLPSGLIIQWGVYGSNNATLYTSAVTISFPITFPTACFTVTPVSRTTYASSAAPRYTSQPATWSSSGFTTQTYHTGGINWIAIGH